MDGNSSKFIRSCHWNFLNELFIHFFTTNDSPIKTLPKVPTFPLNLHSNKLKTSENLKKHYAKS